MSEGTSDRFDDASASGDGSGSESGIAGNVADGFSEFLRVVGLWFGFSAVLNPLSIVANAALVAEPFTFGQVVAQVFALAAVAVTHARCPRVSAFRLWAVGFAATALFSVAALLAGALNAPTNGSLTVVLRLLLLWVGSLALSAAVLGGEWFEGDGERSEGTESA